MTGTWIKKRKDTIETGSALRMWWLTRFQGCKVLEERMSPQPASFGRVTYRKIWMLQPPPVDGGR